MKVLSGHVTTIWLSRQEIESGEAVVYGTAAEQQEQALADLRRAERRGFLGCDAVFVDGQYDGLHERAERNNDRLDWGRGQDVTVRNYFRNGTLERDPEWTPAPPEAAWEAHGLRCHVSYIPRMGHRCGYVGVPEGHPWFGKDYDECLLGEACLNIAARAADPDGYHSCYEHSLDSRISVHGGITWAARDERDGWWYFGFDCAHSGDAKDPAVAAEERRRYGESFGRDDGHYWTAPEVVDETNRLADQLALASLAAAPADPTHEEA